MWEHFQYPIEFTERSQLDTPNEQLHDFPGLVQALQYTVSRIN